LELNVIYPHKTAKSPIAYIQFHKSVVSVMVVFEIKVLNLYA